MQLSIYHMQFLSRVSTLTRDIDIAILSVCHVAVFYENGLTYCHSFFTTRVPNYFSFMGIVRSAR